MKLNAPILSMLRTIALSLMIAATILLSPFVLLGLSRLEGAEWAQLSNVGQAYGSTSEIISAIALVAVARSFRMQAKQSRAAELQALRTMHADLARLSFDYPDICSPAFGKDPNDKEYLQDVWRVIHAQYMLAGMEMGEFTETVIRNEFAAGLLSTSAGRNWWCRARSFHIEHSNRHARRLLVQILDEELGKMSTQQDAGSIDAESAEPSEKEERRGRTRPKRSRLSFALHGSHVSRTDTRGHFRANEGSS